jgi:predicted TIM-barrel fold metal-dependent hydrolase
MTGFSKTMKNLDRIGRSMDMPGIRDDDLELILGGNARRLYKLDGKA